MRFLSYKNNKNEGLAILDGQGSYRGFDTGTAGYPGSLESLVAAGGDALKGAAARLLDGPVIDIDSVEFLPPFANPAKIICIGLNYADHTKEGGFAPQTYPTLFGRFASSLIGHKAPLIRPRVSTQLDYEGELVAVIGRGGRHIPKASALDHIAGYSIFNDGSVRDYQLKTPQWTMGKNFDGTGAFGPTFVTADELPPGAVGLTLQTRLNGEVVQKASTDDLVFSVADLVAIISEGITLAPGDIIVTGTPAGIGHARKPLLYMKPGDICEVEIDGLGVLSNMIADEVSE